MTETTEQETKDQGSDQSNTLEIVVQRMYRFETDRPLKAFVDIVINDVLLVKGVRVMDGKQGLFVSMPREQAKDQKWYDTIRCLTEEVRDQITEVVLEAYNEE
jgi:stage V sporulation protein G